MLCPREEEVVCVDVELTRIEACILEDGSQVKRMEEIRLINVEWMKIKKEERIAAELNREEGVWCVSDPIEFEDEDSKGVAGENMK
jgi:hypothetical protein